MDNLHTMKEISQAFRKQGKYHTSSDLAAYMATFLPEHPREVLDPTCGNGALLKPFHNDTPKYGQDIDRPALNDARRELTNFTGVHGDTLTHTPWGDKRFHAIIANPPFSLQWEPTNEPEYLKWAPTVPTKHRADFAFILYIIHHLADDGRAAILNAPGIGYRAHREQQLRQHITDLGIISHIIAIPPDAFVDTDAATLLLIIDKQRGPNTPITIHDKHTGRTTQVTHEDIKNTGYSWRVPDYLPEEITTPTIDIAAISQGITQIHLDLLHAMTAAQTVIGEHLTEDQRQHFKEQAWETINNTYQ